MSVVHVVPIADLIDHDVPCGLDGQDDPTKGRWLTIEAEGGDMNCVCSPTIDLVQSDDGPDGWVVTHHSLDGRECDE
jgi:hypothetical protein